jgi:anti-anti-sigma factor
MSEKRLPTVTIYQIPFASIVQDEEFKHLEHDLMSIIENRDGVRLAVDMGKTFHMSSRALGLFVALRKRLIETGGRLVLFAANPAVQKVMQVTRLNTIIPILATEADARSSLLGEDAKT